MVTFIPMAAAPVAMMKAAMARSMSPLRTTMVTDSGFVSWSSAKATDGSTLVAFISSPIYNKG